MPFFNTHKSENIDYLGYTPVSVIASFNTKGEFIPLHVQIEENNERITLKVDSVHRIVDKIMIIEYECYVILNGKRKLIVLYYFIRDHIWKIKK